VEHGKPVLLLKSKANRKNCW